MPGSIAVRDGYQFSLLAISNCSAGGAPRRLIDLDGPWAVTSDLPDGVIEDWEGMIGAGHRWELERTRLFLWALAGSDHQDLDLHRSVLQLYYGLLIGVPFLSHGRMTLFEGRMSDGRLSIERLDPYHQTWSVAGSPSRSVTVSSVRLAHRVAVQLEAIDRSAGRERFNRILRTFREGCEAESADVRLHQFVRATEGFVVPWKWQHYQDRTSEFCTGRAKPYLKELYQLRGSIEHLRGPYRLMPRWLSKRARLLRLLQRAMLAEVLARTLIVNVLLDPACWSHFESFEAAEAFWRRMSLAQRSSVLPLAINIPDVLRVFDPSRVPT